MGGMPSKSVGISSSRIVDCEHVENPYDTAGCAPLSLALCFQAADHASIG